MQNTQERDGRWAKQFGDFAEHLTMYVMGQLSNMSVALIDHVGADVIAIKRDGSEERYAVSVKGRNIPPTEGKSYNFSQRDIDKLEETAELLKMTPAVSFVFVDEMEGAKKIRVFVAELENVFRLCDDPETGFLKRVSDGISFCYTEGKSRHWLSEIRKCDNILYYEIQFTEMLA